MTILLFGEILPKVYANRNALRFAKLKLTDEIIKEIQSHIQDIGESESLENKFGNVNTLAKKYLGDVPLAHPLHRKVGRFASKTMAFGNTEVRQIMKPRVDVHAIESKTPFNKVLDVILDCGHSRIPVYESNFDNIVGILFIKDLLPILGTTKNYDWLALIRKPFYVPENKKLDDLLAEFQQKKIHLAIVVDEYGGTAGLITLEDILEEIVGDISDEFDELSLSYSQIGKEVWSHQGIMSSEDFYKALELKDTNAFDKIRAEAETLAGFLLEATQIIPKPGQKFKLDGYVFVIETIENKRIQQIKVTIPKD